MQRYTTDCVELFWSVVFVGVHVFVHLYKLLVGLKTLKRDLRYMD